MAWPPGSVAQVVDSSDFARAQTFYFQNNLQKALPLFERTAQDAPAKVEYQNWLAETQRRIGQMDQAVQTARRALRLSRCNSFTYAILGAAFSPQYSNWDLASYDSTWAFLRKAVDCDGKDGNAWLLLWGEALRREDVPLAQRSLRSLITTGFLTRPNLELARWVLNTAPPRAIVVTAGDIDTYPPLALQITDHLRPDVAIVNAPMLDLPWYLLRTSRIEAVPLPIPLDSLAALSARGIVTGELKDSALALWRRQAVLGTLGRPLVYALSNGEPEARKGAGYLRLSGAAWLITSDSATGVDTATVWSALAGLDASRWKGTTLSPQDRSAVRRAAQIPAPLYVMYVSALYGRAMLESGQRDAARRSLRNAEAFAAETALDTAIVNAFLQGLRAALDSAP